MIRAGNIIKHPSFMDVAFLVTRVRGPYGDSKKMEVTGEWINQGFVASWRLNITQKLKMTLDQLNLWQICLDPTIPCLRYAKWR